MAIVGSAEVRINADSSPFERALDTILSSLTGRLRNAGARAGEDFGRTFSAYVKTAIKDIDSAFKDAGKDSGKLYGESVAAGIRSSSAKAAKAAEEVAKDINKATQEATEKGQKDAWASYEKYWKDRLKKEQDHADALVENEERTAKERERVRVSQNSRLARLQFEHDEQVRKATLANAVTTTNVFTRIVSNGMQRAGRSASKSWRDYFDTRTSAGKEAKAAADNFVVFFAKGSAGLTIIATLTAALAQATAGAYALATGLGSAAASSAVLGPSILAIVQAGVVTKVAFNGVGEAIKAGLDPERAEEFAEAMGKLTPAAQNFVRVSIGFREPFRRLRETLQEGFFTNFTEPFERATTAIIPALNEGLSGTAGVAGTLGGQLAESFADTADKAWGLSAALQQNNRFLSIFATETTNIKTGESDSFFGQIASALLKVNAALEPLQTRFGFWLRGLATRADEATTNIERMTNFFNRAGDRAATVGSIIKNLGQALFGIGAASTAAGATDGVLKGIEQAAINLNNTVKENADEIGAYIERARVNLQPLGQLLKDISMAFFELGDTDAAGDTFNTLRDAIPALKEILQVGVDSGPVFADLIVSVSDFLAALADTGAIEWMFKSLTFVFDILEKIASSEIFQKIMLVAAPVLGIAKALSLVAMGARVVGLVVSGSIGKILSFSRGLKNIGKGLNPFGKGKKIGQDTANGMASGLRAGTKKATSATNRMVSSVIATAKARLGIKSPSTVFATIGRQITQGMILGMNQGKTRVAAAGAGLSTAAAGSARAAAAGAGVGGAAAGAGKLGGAARGVSALGGAMRGLSGAVGLLGRAFSFALGPIGIILFTLIPLLIPLIKKLWDENEGLRNAVLGVWEGIKSAVASVVLWFQTTVLPVLVAVWNGVRNGASSLWDSIKPIWEGIKEAVNSAMTFIGDIVQTVWPYVQAIIIGVVTVIWTYIKTYFTVIFTIISTVVKGIWNVIKTVFPIIWTIISTVVSAVWSAIQDSFNGIKAVVEFVMPIIKGAVEAAFNGIGWVWENVLKPVVDAFKNAFEALPGVFETIKTTIGRIWDGVVDVIKTPIRNVINGINDWLIKPLSKVTGVFGLNIETIDPPTFADGGYVKGPGGPRSDKILARISNGEFVVNARSTKKYRPIIEALNRGEVPAIGGPFDWVLDAAAGVKNAASDVANIVLDKLQEGAANALGFVADKAIDPVVNSVRGLGFIGEFIGKIFDQFKIKIREWGTKKDDEAAAAASGAALPPYLGPPEGWTFPLAVGAPATTYPGHNYGAIDFPAAMGTIIRAATSGIVGALISGWGGGYGNNLILSHAQGMQTLYAHILSFLVKQGQYVRAGQPIARVGSTGISTGPHLHFEVRRNGARIDSWSWLRNQGIALAEGGVVPATPGGMLALIGEAGRNERVEPLDSQGMSVRDRAIIAEVARNLVGSGGGGVNVRVFIGAQELTDIVRYEITEQETGNIKKTSIGRRMYQ